ncbi:MAG: hypothetical protein [Caudoviricetes sp.]|nr:MAG: hypothetical protein [Caudoviricetes sp.]
MKEFKGTPGPWLWAEKINNGCLYDGFSESILDENCAEIYSITSNGIKICDSYEKNDVCLISSAPILLEALQGIISKFGAVGDASTWSINDSEEGILAHKAINKALGITE